MTQRKKQKSQRVVFIYSIDQVLQFELMLIRHLWRYRSCLVKISIYVAVSLLFYYNQIKKNKYLSRKLSYNSHENQYEIKSSIFMLRSKQRLFHLDQRFSHINIDQLLHIQSSSTKTLTYFCSINCGGWGDRLRGITSVYILAVLLQRRFIINMLYPCDLSNFLQPNLIDWKTNHNTNQPKNYLILD